MNDKKLLYAAIVLLILPLSLAFCGGDRFRYPCQDSDNWDKDFCKPPKCDVTRTCPEHIFKGQRDPRLGPPVPESTQPVKQSCVVNNNKGANCGK